MARPEKTAAVDDVHERLTSSAATLLTDYRGLDVSDLAELRAQLRKANASYRVVKNTLTVLAAQRAGIDGLEEYLVGPTALVFCAEDPVGPAKALRDFGREHPELIVKAGYLEGEVLDAEATTKLADLESREELIAKLAGLLYGALANTARLLRAPLEHQARLFQALVDEGGWEGAPPEPAAPAAAADEAPAEEAAAAEAPAADEGAADEGAAAEAPAAEEAPAAASDDDTAAEEAPAAASDDDTAATAVEQQAEAIADRVEETVTDAASSVADAVVSGVAAVTGAVGDAADEATEAVTDAASDAADTVEDAAASVTGIGQAEQTEDASGDQEQSDTDDGQERT